MQMKKNKMIPLFAIALIICMALLPVAMTASASEPYDEEFDYGEYYGEEYYEYYEDGENYEYADGDMIELPDEYYGYRGGNAFTPDGTGTVIDNATDSDGKEFYTIETPDGNVFYLIIDKQRNSENVYFLGAVTEEDLMSLAKPGNGKPAPEEDDVPMPLMENTAEMQTEPPTPAPEPQGNDDIMLYAILGVAVLGIGGAAYYFKIAKPKNEGADYSGDYGEGYDDDDDDDNEDEEDEREEEYDEGEETPDEEGYEEGDGDFDDGAYSDAPAPVYDIYGVEQKREQPSGTSPPQSTGQQQGNRNSRKRRRRRKKPNYSG